MRLVGHGIELDDRPALELDLGERGEHALDIDCAAAQLDELYQIERWGEDPIAAKRHAGIKDDIGAGARFLALLESQRLK